VINILITALAPDSPSIECGVEGFEAIINPLLESAGIEADDSCLSRGCKRSDGTEWKSTDKWVDNFMRAADYVNKR
jgi:hypothetical protein